MKCVNELLHDAKTSKTPIASVRELCWYFSLNVKCLPVRLDCPVSRVHPDGGVLLVVECPEVAAVPGQERVRCKSVSASRHPLVSAGAGPAGHHPPGGQHRSWTLHIQTTSSTSTAISCTCALRVEAAVRHVNLDDHQPGPHRRNVRSILLPDLKLVFCNIVNTCLILTALQHYTLLTFNQVQKYYL